MKSLAYFSVSSNNMYGSIPTSIGNLSSLAYLALFDNDFDGSIPESLNQTFITSNIVDMGKQIHFTSIIDWINDITCSIEGTRQ